MRPVKLASLWNFDLQVKTFQRWGDSFIVKRYGTSREIYRCYNGSATKFPYRYMDTANKKQGMHICVLVRKDLLKRIESGEYELKKYPDNYRPPTVYFNAENIKANLFKRAYALDMTSCYFTTAFQIGVIGEHVYKLGNKKDREWKDARNISIGTLGKTIDYDIYKDGKLVETRTVTDPLKAARIEVVDRVNEVARDIFTECYDGCNMFLTDCFYLLPEYVEKAERILAEYGYQCKAKEMYFKNIDTIGSFTHQVRWEDVVGKKSKKKSKTTQQYSTKKAALYKSLLIKKTRDEDHWHCFNSSKNQFIINK